MLQDEVIINFPFVYGIEVKIWHLIKNCQACILMGLETWCYLYFFIGKLRHFQSLQECVVHKIVKHSTVHLLIFCLAIFIHNEGPVVVAACSSSHWNILSTICAVKL